MIIAILVLSVCASRVLAGTDDRWGNRTVGTSVSIPVVGEKVRVEISPEALVEGRRVCVVGPTERVELPVGNEGVAEWSPSRYGKHVLEYGPHQRVIWVASRPVIFNWWTTKTYPEFITSAMIDKGQDAEYWKKRGVTRLYWIGGAYLADEKNQDPPFSKPADWLGSWKAGLSQYVDEPRVGVCLDELYATDRRSDGICIPQAVVGLREAAGDLFSIGIYYSGIEETFSDGMWHLRAANCIHLEECYWGDENVYRKRWQDITLYRIQDRAVLVISPGFRQSDQVRGSLTPEELVKEFAMVRRVAPDAAGLGVFNAYDCPELERLADRLIEDYFFKPVVHLEARQGQVEARNIGHEDASGDSIVFLDSSGQELEERALPVLRPWACQLLDVPSGAARVRLNVPDNVVNIYPHGVYELPEVLDLLQVTKSSVEEGALVSSPSGDFAFTATFSRGLHPDCIKPENIFLRGVRSKNHCCIVTWDEKSRSIVARFRDLPSDCYTLRLLSGKTRFRCDRGLPLDGSGNGLLDEPFDHYAVHFKLER